MKGISPLLSAILLIAFALSVGVIIKGWFEGLSKKTTTHIGEKIEEKLLCSEGSISLSEVEFCNQSLSGKIENTGRINLEEISLLVVYPTSTQTLKLCRADSEIVNCTEANLTLIPREVVLFNISTSPNFEVIRVLTNCKEVYDEVKSKDVIFC